MKNNDSTNHGNENADDETTFPGYPPYPQNEDIYNQLKKDETVDPEDISKVKAPVVQNDTVNELDFSDTATDNDLDIPGSELDDEQEEIGSEDEENNYYSLGGDNHTDLEEREEQL